ncbi:MAG: hypothetical protein KKF52_00955 [Nanoarchaeota archaeon]|nr:hypothetical protein [Nanoarchaeota archaeon]MBU4351876.1 hypothetical protein [Nanoarchaeota archaeon]
MEYLLDYRHVIEEKTKNIFFNCIKKAIKELKPKKIGFIGVMGSYNNKYSHDIDVLIFPKKNVKLGETIIEVGKFYKKTESILKKHHDRFYLALCPKKIMQERVYYLSTLEEGSAGMIPIHSLFFSDYKAFKSFNPKGFEKEIQRTLLTFYGNFNIIKELKPLPQKKLEPYFIILDFEMNSRTKTFPRHLIRSSAESLFSYLQAKYDIEIKTKKMHNISEIEKEFERVLKYLDKINY